MDRDRVKFGDEVLVTAEGATRGRKRFVVDQRRDGQWLELSACTPDGPTLELQWGRRGYWHHTRDGSLRYVTVQRTGRTMDDAA